VGVAVIFGANQLAIARRREATSAEAGQRQEARLERQIEVLLSINARLARIEAKREADDGNGDGRS
jgi:hypothetical protein